MAIAFEKWHGAGNDFVLIDDRTDAFPSADRALIARIGARGTGVGCEGVILVRTSTRADFRMKFFNPDGSDAELCGNGARCVAAFARAIGAVKSDKMRFETDAGDVEAEILGDGLVRVVMPNPYGLNGDFIVAGVPHFIVPVADVGAVNVNEEGRRLRYDARFAPAGTNVDFVEYHPPHRAKIRTYERGVEAESGACGTGSVAAAVIGVENHGMSFPVELETQGGYVLSVDGRRNDGHFELLTLTGPVKKTFTGVLEDTI